MKGSQARSQLARAAQLARRLDLAPSRADRLRTGVRVRAADLGELRSWPQWPVEPESEQRRIFAVTALRASDDALRAVIAGSTLRAYAAEVGESLLEDVLARPGRGSAPLPLAPDLVSAGRDRAHRALPARLAERFGINPVQDAEASRNVAEAEVLVRMAPPQEIPR